jgi:hypothetical protein
MLPTVTNAQGRPPPNFLRSDKKTAWFSLHRQQEKVRKECGILV